MLKTMPDMTAPSIRPLANSADAEACARLMCSTDPWVTLNIKREQALRMLTDPLRNVFVLGDADDLQGFVVIVLQGAFVGYIQTVAVAPGSRGRGVGTQLIHFAEQKIFQVSPNVFMCVSDFNTGAQRLYARLGYQPVGELKDYFERGRSELLLRKSLAPIAEFYDSAPQEPAP
jgi:ribosomal-protein-alanine N-acetyltransferase